MIASNRGLAVRAGERVRELDAVMAGTVMEGFFDIDLFVYDCPLWQSKWPNNSENPGAIDRRTVAVKKWELLCHNYCTEHHYKINPNILVIDPRDMTVSGILVLSINIAIGPRN